MATRSRIGIELKDGSILSAYHHWDGYPQWLGRILNTHYNSRQQAADLIDGGDMSTCWTNERWTGKDLAPYVKEIKETEEYGPQYYSQRGRIALLGMIKPVKSFCLMVKSSLTSSPVLVGCAMI